MLARVRVRVRVSRALGTLTLIVWAVPLAHTIRVRVPRALKTLTLILANMIEPAGCKGLLGYGGWFRIRNHFEFVFY